MNILELIEKTSSYLSYIYPGYVTIYLYYYFNALSVRDSKATIIKSIVISYIYTILIKSIVAPLLKFIFDLNVSTKIDNVGFNIILLCCSIIMPYVFYRLKRSEKLLHILKRFGIETMPDNNEIELLERKYKKTIWIRVYIKNTNIVYAGYLTERDLEYGSNRFFCLSKYKKLRIKSNGKEELLTQYTEDEMEKVLIYYDQVSHFEIVNLHKGPNNGDDISKENDSEDKIDKKNYYLEFITIIISIIAIIVSVICHNDMKNLQKEYDTLSTYDMALNYTLEISQEEGDGEIFFDDTTINTGAISVTPKVGGIDEIYAVYSYQDNINAILPLNMYYENMETEKNAQSLQYKINSYTIDCMAENSNYYYGTIFLVVKDYQNNYHTNMIVYEINKHDMTINETRIYSEIDLLHIYNQNVVLPAYDFNQMQEYHNLLNKLENIL